MNFGMLNPRARKHGFCSLVLRVGVSNPEPMQLFLHVAQVLEAQKGNVNEALEMFNKERRPDMHALAFLDLTAYKARHRGLRLVLQARV